MKTLNFSCLLTCLGLLGSLFCTHIAYAQVPAGIHFQAVARDNQGVALTSTPISIRFTVQDGGNNPVYRETHTLTTDMYGLLETSIGMGTPNLGSFAAIDWAAGPYRVLVEIDDGGGFTSLGTTSLASVPYSLYAEKANMDMGDLGNVNLSGLSIGQTLSWDGTEWVPANPAASSIWNQNATNAYYAAGRVGIGIDTPRTTLHLPDTSNVLWGTNTTGSGFKFLYYGQKGALRVGYLNNPFGGYNYDKFWDYDSVGYYSFAGGRNSRAKGFGAFAFGSSGWADGSGSVAFFGHARGNNSFTFGGSSKGRGSITFEGVAEEEGGIAMYGYTGGRYGVSIGGGTTGLGASSSREDYAVAIGWNSDARGQASIAMGPSDAYGYNAFSTGWVTEARGNYSFTMGYQTNSYPYASLALGRFNLITGDSASWVATDPVLMIGDGTSNSNRSNSFVILKNGQTAIGYNSPTGMLQVSSALGSINVGNTLTPANAALLIGTTTNGMAFDANQIEGVNNDIYINFNSDREVRIAEGGGNVGIGKNPAARFEIEQTANAVGGGMRINGFSSTNYWDVFYDTRTDLQFAYRGTSKASIDAGTGAYNQLSDRHLKRDIRPMEAVLPQLMKLKPSTYFYRDESQHTRRSVGFIAQEVAEVFPDRVYRTGNHLSLAYDEFSVLAVKAIQEQQQLITKQEKRLQQAESLLGQQQQLIEALERRLSQLELAPQAHK
ncbi:MAG: hypothetical protein D6730_15475 [Bacteroidetes bacterium]|nr:MAG: hypothetical protein D6730_15475 [Bacteroidota bacterium]